MKWDYVKDFSGVTSAIHIVCAPTHSVFATLTAVQGDDWNGFRIERCAMAICALLNGENPVKPKETPNAGRPAPDLERTPRVVNGVLRPSPAHAGTYARLIFEYAMRSGIDCPSINDMIAVMLGQIEILSSGGFRKHRKAPPPDKPGNDWLNQAGHEIQTLILTISPKTPSVFEFADIIRRHAPK